MTRTFHPVGQGAYYTEKHRNFNVVYDCGNWKNSNKAKSVVQASFKTSDEIDILFISHFDYDHTSLIETLNNHCNKIHTVILPLLYQEEKILLSNIYKSINPDDSISDKLILNPEEYFGSETKIVYIDILKDIKTDYSIINYDELVPNQTIPSLTRISINDNWLFIPFNYKYEERNKHLVKLLNEKKINISQLRNNVNFAIDKRAVLKKIYDTLESRINQNSMFLYSGPSKPINFLTPNLFQSKPEMLCISNQAINSKLACIYTGDGNLNLVNLQNIYENQWSNVGTIQIPHHGDKKSYNNMIFSNDDNKQICCPISVGNNNTYGHPSKEVIDNLEEFKHFPICITEEENSIFFLEYFY